MDVASEAIEFVQNNPLREGDPESWRRLQDGLRERVLALNTNATGALHSFERVSDEYVAEKFRLKPTADVPPQVGSLANHLWRHVDGDDDPIRAGAIISAACVEFARSQFDASLFGIAFHASDMSLRERVRHSAAAIPAQMKGRPWRDADAIARTPYPTAWFSQSAADNFNGWLYTTGEHHPVAAYTFREPVASMKPTPKDRELLAAIALIWLDESIRNPATALALMAEIAEVTQSAGSRWGWECHEDLIAEGSTTFAKKGAAARHATNYARRDAIIAAYKSGQHGAVKDRAAQELSAQFSVPWRTVRDYLRGR